MHHKTCRSQNSRLSLNLSPWFCSRCRWLAGKMMTDLAVVFTQTDLSLTCPGGYGSPASAAFPAFLRWILNLLLLWHLKSTASEKAGKQFQFVKQWSQREWNKQTVGKRQDYFCENVLQADSSQPEGHSKFQLRDLQLFWIGKFHFSVNMLRRWPWK